MNQNLYRLFSYAVFRLKIILVSRYCFADCLHTFNPILAILKLVFVLIGIRAKQWMRLKFQQSMTCCNWFRKDLSSTFPNFDDKKLFQSSILSSFTEAFFSFTKKKRNWRFIKFRQFRQFNKWEFSWLTVLILLHLKLNGF